MIREKDMLEEEDRELLRKSICENLPYGLMVQNFTFKEATEQTVYGIVSDTVIMAETYLEEGKTLHYTGVIDYIKPFLRPLSSMTKEEMEEYSNITGFSEITMVPMSAELDWLNSHHFDHRGLLPRGLAIEDNGIYNRV